MNEKILKKKNQIAEANKLQVVDKDGRVNSEKKKCPS